MPVSTPADTPDVPARVENADKRTALVKGVEPVEHPAAVDLRPLFVSEGLHQELLTYGRAADPLSGRIVVLDDAGSPRFL